MFPGFVHVFAFFVSSKIAASFSTRTFKNLLQKVLEARYSVPGENSFRLCTQN